MQIISYNVNGIRAAIKKGLIEWLENAAVDVLCVQETKASPEDIDISIFTSMGYHVAWYPAQKRDIVEWPFLVRKSQTILYTVMVMR